MLSFEEVVGTFCSLEPGTDCWAKFLKAAAKECAPWFCVPGPGPGTA